MSQLVAQRTVEITLVGPQEDGPGAWQGHGGAPGRDSARRERIQIATVGNDDEPERAGAPGAETGPGGALAGSSGELDGQVALVWPRNGGDLSDAYCQGRFLRGRSGARQRQPKEKGNCQPLKTYWASGLRGTSPPAEATSNISRQRLAQGLNLFAL